MVPPGGYYAERWRHGVLMPPLGLAYLGTALKAQGVKVEIVDAHAEGMGRRALAGRMRRSAPDIVGVTFTTENRAGGFAAIRLAKKELPECVTVAGGPHASLTADDCLRHVPELDVVVRGEGERTLGELVDAVIARRAFEKIDGISFQRDGEPVHNPGRGFIRDLDGIAFPDRGLLNIDRYNFYMEVPGEDMRKAAAVLSSRGCPHGCIFCSSTVMWGKRVRFRSPENVVDEIEQQVKERGIGAVWFLDDTFTLERERVEEICDLIVERRIDVRWFCEVRVDSVDRELLERMRNAGCRRVGFGVESGSKRILREVLHQKVNLDTVRDMATWCRELGIVAHPFFALSHPGETYEDAEATFDLIRRFVPTHEPSLSLLHIYPGTALEAMAKERGILPRDFSWAEPAPQVEAFLPPSVQGDVPIFKDRLGWKEIGHFLREWGELSGGRYSVMKSLPGALTGMGGWGGVKRGIRFLAGPGSRMLGSSLRRPASVASRLSRVYWNYVVSGKARLDYLPIRLWIEPSSECNLRCVMCPQSAEERIQEGFMRTALFEKIIDECADFADDVSLHHRGESLLHPEICRMIEYAARKGLYTKLHTNASLLDAEMSRKLLETGLDNLTFSFDGVDPAGYEKLRIGAKYEDVLENILGFLHAKEQSGRDRPYTMLEVLDLPELGITEEMREKFAARFESVGLDELEMKKPHNWGGAWQPEGGEQSPEYTSHCLFPWFALTVLWDGTVLPCPQDFFGRQPLGNANDSTLAEIWSGERIVALRQAMLERRFGELDPCAGCDMLTRPTILGIPKSSFSAVWNILKFW